MTTTSGFSPRLYNEDLAPAKARNWGTYSLFAMWMSDIHSIGGYTFAAGLFVVPGLNALGVFGSLTGGIILVFLLMNLSGYAGQRLGVPYPVLSRISFGTFGANIPALIRAFVAIFWYSVQTFLASEAVVILALKLFPGLASIAEPESAVLGLTPIGWFAFLFMWALQLLLLRNGMDTIRRFQDWAGPAVWVVMFALAIYILAKSDWAISLTLPGQAPQFGSVHAFLAATALTVSYFSTLLLNFCDFSRFAPSRGSVFRANLWGLPANFIAFSIVSVLVTAGTVKVYGEAISDPVKVVGKIDNVLALVLGAVTFAVATLGINVVANFVSPAYDLANVAPGKVDFKRGGLISAVIALFLFPWYLFKNPYVVNLFIGGLASFLGPLFGVIMVDYYLLRKQKVVAEDLYREDGHYSYGGRGWNPKAIAAAAPAAVLAFLPTILSLSDSTKSISDFWGPFSWFIGVIVAGGIYFLIARHDTHLLDSLRDPRATDADVHVHADA